MGDGGRDRISWFPWFQRHRVPVIVALFAVLLAGYHVSGAPQDRVLTVFVLAPLFVGLFGTSRSTAWTLVGAVGITWGVWMIDHPLPGSSFVGRMAVVVLGGSAAVIAAWNRERQQRALVTVVAREQMVATFMSQLVPDLADVPGFDLAVHYEPGEQRMQLGGDFLDVVGLDDGSLAFIIGDVCGHGPEAAALGVSLRAGWHTVTRVLPPDPARWLERLDRAFVPELHRMHVTAITGIVTPGCGSVRLSAAGHPYPLSLGTPNTLHRLANDPPLGLGAAAEPRTLHHIELGGRPLLVVTDGLWESQRGPDGNRVSMDAVLDALDARPTLQGADGLALLADGFRPASGGFEDDVAVLLIAPDAAT